MVRKDIEKARKIGFMCFEPDGSKASYEVLEHKGDIEYFRDFTPCHLCKLNNSIGKYGCPFAL